MFRCLARIESNHQVTLCLRTRNDRHRPALVYASTVQFGRTFIWTTYWQIPWPNIMEVDLIGNWAHTIVINMLSIKLSIFIVWSILVIFARKVHISGVSFSQRRSILGCPYRGAITLLPFRSPTTTRKRTEIVAWDSTAGTSWNTVGLERKSRKGLFELVWDTS